MRTVLVASVALATTACHGGEPPPRPVPRCELGAEPPGAFARASVTPVPERDHVGTRAAYRDPAGRSLTALAGVSGEFAERLPFVNRVDLRTGSEGFLYGEGETWIFSWAGAGACGRRALIGNGFTARGFARLLEQMEIVGRTS